MENEAAGSRPFSLRMFTALFPPPRSLVEDHWRARNPLG
jgi:hypothetical protein